MPPWKPGESGNPHRGPDLGLRRHLIRGVLLEAMARKGESIKSLRNKNPKGKRKVIPHAMTEYIAEGLERIAIAATGVRGPKLEVQAWGALLRMVRDMHEILQPAKEEEKRDLPVIVPIFKLAKSTTTDAAAEPEPAPETTQPLKIDGQVYE